MAAARFPLLLTPTHRGMDGLSRLSRLYASALSDAHEGVEVWSLTDSPDGSPSPVRVQYRSAGSGRARYALWALNESVRSQEGRLVVVLHTHLAPVGLPLVLRGARLVHVLVGIECWRPLSRLQANALARAARVLSISQHTRSRFALSNPSFGETAIAVCHPGLPDREPTEREGRGGNFALVVGRMARDEQYKGHEQLFRAWAQVRESCPAARLVVVGEGDDRARLAALVEELGLHESIRFTGRVTDVELARLYQDCAFFVMPSRGEGFGFVYLEAMRAAKACIGGLDAAAEIIEDGRTGSVVSSEDGLRLVEVLKRYLTDANLCAEHGRRGRERFLAHFTEARFRERLKAILSERWLRMADSSAGRDGSSRRRTARR